ncbi:Calcyclin-binding protein [Armadillidium nasatum]|uniref:Calcyclin-binding protein n=1 Tax=Armadillidium nasatum TaxID=96803 RepID=A0A5N5T9H7_9CRUS|nr:Calcyclin-binding protein [Armadillidium nasatum]
MKYHFVTHGILLRQDAKEAKTLLETATRQRIKDVLSLELLKIETKIKNLEENESRSAWDQSDKFLKLYITLNDVHNLNKENIVCDFEKQGLSFKVKELEGKNHELNIARTAYPILPDKSYFKVKSDMVVIFAAKSNPSVKWEAITFEEKRILDAKKSKTDVGANKDDPTSGLMGIMKQDMLNKTWYESQQKTKGGLESDLAGMNMDI